MKYSKLSFIPLSLLTLVLMLVFCTKEETDTNKQGVPDNNGDITFEIVTSLATRVSTGADFNSAWEEGDEIGIFAVKRASNSAKGLSAIPADNYINNQKLTYNGVSWRRETSMNWPDDEDVLDFYAYYPYNASANNPTNILFNVMTDQNEKTNGKLNYNLSDLLTAKSDNAGNGYSKGSVIPLVFSHALAMIHINVSSNDKSYSPRVNPTVMLTGVKTKAVLNLGAPSGAEVTTATTNNDPVNIKMYRIENTENTKNHTYRALIPVQTINRGNSLFRLEHEEYLFADAALSSDLVLAKGKVGMFERIFPTDILYTSFIPKGTFMMGSPANEPGHNVNTEIQHEVTLTQNFRMGKYQVTKEQYAVFLNAIGVSGVGISGRVRHDVSGYGTQDLFIVNGSDWTPVWNPEEKKWEATGTTPMIHVTWFGAKAYADWVKGSLPTEAQWEYACRAGTTTAFSFGANATLSGDYAWSVENSHEQSGPSPVGLKLPNPWLLYDMHGNVMEWCSDWYADDYGGTTAVTDPTGPPTGTTRPYRGGAWQYISAFCRSARRGNSSPERDQNIVGFRIMFTIP